MGDTKKRGPERVEKTIAGHTFDATQPVGQSVEREYHLGPETFAPKPGTDIIPQAFLETLAEDERTLADMEAHIKARKAALVERLRAGAVCAPGAYVVSVKVNMKPQRVEWKQAFIDAMGEAEAKAIEASAKGGAREVSSYGLELRRADGGKQHGAGDFDILRRFDSRPS